MRILAYHGVVEQRRDERVEESFHLLADFREQLRYLRRCHVVGIAELPDVLRARTVRPRVVITFDDGFANNLRAAELLAAARLPATFFVTTEAVTRRQPIWPTVLRLILARGSARRLELAGEVFDVDDPAAFTRVRNVLKALPTARRLEVWAELERQLRDGELAELLAAFPNIAMMSWDDVRSLRASGFTIGSHGYLHELLHEAQPPALRHHELVTSKQQLEAALGERCDWFAFPNGTHHAGSADEVRAAGYTTAFTMRSRAASARDDMRLLPRIVAGGGADQLLTKLFFGN